ncbi:MAG: YbhB/YbcL family Raf kinase inhibitor-like protein [Candidatus Anstonellaceae archaeon]
MKNKAILILIIFFLFLFFAFGFLKNENQQKKEEVRKIKIFSPAFEDNGFIPQKYTCKGEDINPPLKISNISKEAKSLVLIVEDPDAPLKTFTHWVVFNLEPNIDEIKEGKPPDANFGLNDFKTIEWKGPCPPSGTHRYYFRLFELNKKILLNNGATKEELQKEMEGGIIEETYLIGKFSK